MDMKFGGRVGLLLLGREEGLSELSRLALEDWSSDVEGETLRSRPLRTDVEIWLGDEGGEEDWPFEEGFEEGAASLKMWIVSVAEETQRSVLAALKDMLYIRAGMLPRRNWKSFLPDGMAKMRITVPFSDEVAMSVPS